MIGEITRERDLTPVRAPIGIVNFTGLPLPIAPYASEGFNAVPARTGIKRKWRNSYLSYLVKLTNTAEYELRISGNAVIVQGSGTVGSLTTNSLHSFAFDDNPTFIPFDPSAMYATGVPGQTGVVPKLYMAGFSFWKMRFKCAAAPSFLWVVAFENPLQLLSFGG